MTIPIPLSAWKARQTDPDTLALLDQLLDEHTDAVVRVADRPDRSQDVVVVQELCVVERRVLLGLARFPVGVRGRCT